MEKLFGLDTSKVKNGLYEDGRRIVYLNTTYDDHFKEITYHGFAFEEGIYIVTVSEKYKDTDVLTRAKSIKDLPEDIKVAKLKDWTIPPHLVKKIGVKTKGLFKNTRITEIYISTDGHTKIHVDEKLYCAPVDIEKSLELWTEAKKIIKKHGLE